MSPRPRARHRRLHDATRPDHPNCRPQKCWSSLEGWPSLGNHAKNEGAARRVPWPRAPNRPHLPAALPRGHARRGDPAARPRGNPLGSSQPSRGVAMAPRTPPLPRVARSALPRLGGGPTWFGLGPKVVRNGTVSSKPPAKPLPVGFVSPTALPRLRRSLSSLSPALTIAPVLQ